MDDQPKKKSERPDCPFVSGPCRSSDDIRPFCGQFYAKGAWNVDLLNTPDTSFSISIFTLTMAMSSLLSNILLQLVFILDGAPSARAGTLSLPSLPTICKCSISCDIGSMGLYQQLCTYDILLLAPDCHRVVSSKECLLWRFKGSAIKGTQRYFRWLFVLLSGADESVFIIKSSCIGTV